MFSNVEDRLYTAVNSGTKLEIKNKTKERWVLLIRLKPKSKLCNPELLECMGDKNFFTLQSIIDEPLQKILSQFEILFITEKPQILKFGEEKYIKSLLLPVSLVSCSCLFSFEVVQYQM
ncbi:MAG: hypothetical protein WCT07_00580 [Candidatus Paceibacterota bacterium]|jgi:hypothetical protein